MPTLLSYPVRRSAAGDGDRLGGEAVPEVIETALRRRSGTGTSMPDALVQDMSSGFGADLSGVRVHTDPEAAHISGQLQAVAFTRGQDIYFASGAYRPESTPGRRLLAHELAHVVQQRSSTAGSGRRGVIGRADDPAERQADQLAARVTRRSSPVTRAPAGARRSDLPLPAAANQSGVVQRYVVDDLKTKDKKLHRELRAKYVTLNDGDEHYGREFDDKADSATTVAQMQTFVTAAEAKKQARPVVVPQLPADPTPVTKPVVTTPVVQTGPAKKIKPKVTTLTMGSGGYVAPVVTAVDPYAGLSAKVRTLAEKITVWKKNEMGGTAQTLSASEQAELRGWVESRQTPSGLQKFVVNVGPGTGTYTGTHQFKVTGFGSIAGKAPTYHITL